MNTNNNLQSIWYIVGVIAIVALALLVFLPKNGTDVPADNIDSFSACLEAGHAVMESYPRQCRTSNGEIFVEDIGNELEKRDQIRLTVPRPSTVIESPLTLRGEARGSWYFEASFPIRLIDADGNEVGLSQPYVMTEEEWMTENFVPFEETITFQSPETDTGVLILEKSNPSGMPENADELRIPIRFSP